MLRWVLPEYIQDALPAEAAKLEGFDGRDEEWQKRAGLMYLNYGQFDEGRAGGNDDAGQVRRGAFAVTTQVKPMVLGGATP